MLEVDPFDHIPDAVRTDWDAVAAAKHKGAGKGRKKQPNHKPRAKERYADLGMVLELRETARWIDGAIMKCDYLGLFDGVVLDKEGREILGVQICSKEGVTSHIRKMCSEKRGLAGNRRKNLIKWLEAGKKAEIIYFYQTEGKGTRWQHGIRPVTMDDVKTISEGKRLKF